MKLLERKNPAIVADVRHHIKDEEKDLLPRLREVCSAEKLDRLGERVLATEKVAPTRPYSHAPSKPPANLDSRAGRGVRRQDPRRADRPEELT
ncbi:hypothetical protein [Amycolatopsis sp. M39]|uniref:hypothetical protein n=1 Tax=Amycolatopsis TaxID=1813 RepID=UPI0007DECD2E|nr:hypothetical protein A4R44_09173 [Amycolatopsis sp. M39]